MSCDLEVTSDSARTAHVVKEKRGAQSRTQISLCLHFRPWKMMGRSRFDITKSGNMQERLERGNKRKRDVNV